MKILIGGVDYSGALDAIGPLTVVRKLNAPSTCRLWVSLPPLFSGCCAGRAGAECWPGW